MKINNPKTLEKNIGGMRDFIGQYNYLKTLQELKSRMEKDMLDFYYVHVTMYKDLELQISKEEAMRALDREIMRTKDIMSDIFINRICSDEE